MCAEKQKDHKDKSTRRSPEQFKGMFGMMSKCFNGDTGLSGCTEFMESMKDSCCSPRKEGEKSEDCS